MKIYLSVENAITSMHERGYINDFQLSGNDLLWVQGKIFIRTTDFSIVEYHRFTNTKKNGADQILFGIVALNNSTRGILLNHYSHYTLITPPVIVKKLNEMTSSIAY